MFVHMQAGRYGTFDITLYNIIYIVTSPVISKKPQQWHLIATTVLCTYIIQQSILPRMYLLFSLACIKVQACLIAVSKFLNALG